MEVRVLLNAEEMAKKLQKNMDKAGQQVRDAMLGAANDAAEAIEQRGRADIAAAGKFGGDWQSALAAEVSETQRTVRVVVSMQGGPPITYWHVFEYGASIFAHNAKGLLTWPNKSAFSIDGVVPAFISKASVTIPQKFHLREIIADVAKELKSYYAERMK